MSSVEDNQYRNVLKDYTFQGKHTDERVLAPAKQSENYRGSSSYAMQSSTYMKSSNSNIRLEEIRKKYDTPTRNSLKDNTSYRQKQIQQMKASKQNIGRSSMLAKDFAKGPTDYQPEKTFDNSNLRNSRNMGDSKKGFRAKWDMDQSKDFDNKIYKNEEQTVFRRIKQMKQSLMSKNNQNGNTEKYTEYKYDKAKVTKSIIENDYNGIKKSQNSQQQGPRIDNIDKINNKIQQILSCLKQNQNRNKTYDRMKDSVQQSTYGNNKQSYFKQETRTQISSKTNYTNFNQPITTIQNYNKEKYDKYDNKSSSSFVIKQSASIYREDNKIQSPYINQKSHKFIGGKQKQQNTDKKQINDFRMSENKRDQSRTRSFISSVRKQNNERGNTYELHSGKKLDDQIGKIQDKIKQFQEQKKKLDIDFKPFQYSRSHSRSSSNLRPRSYTISKIGQKSDYKGSYAETKKFLQHRDHHKQKSDFEVRQKQYGSITKNYNLKSSYTEQNFGKNLQNGNINVQIKNKQSSFFIERPRSTQDQQSNSFKIKLIPVTNNNNDSDSMRGSFGKISRQKTDKRQQTINQENEKSQYRRQLRKKTDEGIQYRRKKMNGSSSFARNCQQTKRLIVTLSQQCKLDEQFRNKKIIFQADMQKDKWEKLEAGMKKQFNKQKFSAESIKQIFTVTDEQNNPFFSLQQGNEQLIIDDIVSAYKKSQQHWQKQVMNKFNRQKLTDEEFKLQKLDLEKKGYIVLEDIVRLLNIETGTFYRNRDLVLIFKRITKSQKLQFENMMKMICTN